MKAPNNHLNLASNLGFFLLNSLASLWLVSFLVRKLGLEVYGLVPLAITVGSYVSIITAGLNTSVARHLAFSKSIGDSVGFKQTFSTAFLAGLGLFFLLAIVAGFVQAFITHFIVVPASLHEQVRWLFFLTVMSLAVGTASAAHFALLYAENRLDLQNLANAGGLLARVFLIALLLSLFEPNLFYVGLGILTAALVSWGIALRASATVSGGIRFSARSYDRSKLGLILHTGGWTLVNQVGTLLMVSVDLVVANRMLGAQTVGAYASIIQWSVLLRNLGLTISSTFGPTVVRLHAENKKTEMVGYLRKTCRLMGFTIAIPCGVLAGFSEPLLNVWLGPAVAQYSHVMVVLILPLSINMSYLPLSHVALAANKVKALGISQLVAGIANVALAILLAQNLGAVGIALSGAIVLTSRNLIFTPIYAAWLLRQRWYTFHKDLGTQVGAVAAFFLLSSGASLFIQPSTLVTLAALGSACGAVCVLLVWRVFLSAAEREEVAAAVYKKLRKRPPGG